MKKKAIFNWSSGKDSALALYKVLQRDEFELGEVVQKTYLKPQSSEDEKSSEFEQYGFWYVDLIPG